MLHILVVTSESSMSMCFDTYTYYDICIMTYAFYKVLTIARYILHFAYEMYISIVDVRVNMQDHVMFLKYMWT